MTQEIFNEYELPAEYQNNDSGTGEKYSFIKQKPGVENIVCILPNSPGTGPEPGAYWATHFGWKGVSKNDKPAHRPIVCNSVWSYGKMVKECPICRYMNEKKKELAPDIEAEKKELDAMYAKAREKGITDKNKINEAKEKIKEKRKDKLGWLDDHNCNNKAYLRVKTLDGKYGLFQIGANLYKAIWNQRAETDLFRETAKKNYPGTTIPIQLAGRKAPYIKAWRVGFGRETKDHAELFLGPDFQPQFNTLTDAGLKEIETVFGTLASIKNKQVYSDEVLEKLVALDRAGNGVADPVEVDKLLRPAKPKNDLAPEPDDPFGADEPAKPAPTPETKVEAKVESKPAPAPAPTPAPKAETKQAPAPAPVVETPATDDDIDSIFA